MTARHASVGAAVLMAATLMTATLITAPVGAPGAAAGPCPDSEVVFARGSGQAAGLGDVGEAFVDALRSKAPSKSVDAYPVNYPASHDYRNSAALGETDATAHIQSTVANCPDTKLVLGGYSQGASVIEMSSNALPPETAGHVAAVVLFGPPSNTSAYSNAMWGGPLPMLAAAYQPMSIAFCIPDDIVCADSGNMIPHLMYVQDGKPDEAAAFAASRI